MPIIYRMLRLAIHFSITAFFFILISCSDKEDEKRTGGVIFTFDDNYIDSWVTHRDLFIKYNIKATFFISKPYLLDSVKVADLKLLNSDGHEIGSHGMYHLDATEYTELIDHYIDYEVLPALNLLNSYGFQIKSFAYPYGQSSDGIDSAMSDHFSFLRKATLNYNDTTIDKYNEIYASANSHNIIYSMGIDNIFQISLENIENGLLRASERDEVLVLCAHSIDTLAGDYIIDPEYLENAFKLISKYDIKSMRMSDMDDYFDN
jgi:peptidoglycan/xylan/chitin deacetylase (PgdA/CDA1 family)